jgi:hypothetical protein
MVEDLNLILLPKIPSKKKYIATLANYRTKKIIAGEYVGHGKGGGRENTCQVEIWVQWSRKELEQSQTLL